MFCVVHAGGEWLSLVPFVGTVSLITYVTVKAFQPKPPENKKPAVNLKIQKETAKVVNIIDVEDIGEKVSYCRCWRSKRVSHRKGLSDSILPFISCILRGNEVFTIVT